MRKPLFILLLLYLAALVSAGPAYAIDKRNTGCGLGYYLFKDAQDTFAAQLLAVTTNSFSTQTFGILTETMGCRQPKHLVKDKRLDDFVSANMDSLASDMASGSGESLETLAELMHVPKPDRPVFFSRLQDSFERIFTSRDIQSGQLIDNILKAAG